MRPWIVLQCRMASTRLPGKALLPLGPWTSVGLILCKLQGLPWPHHAVLATTRRPEDTCLARLGRSLGLQVTRGPEADVLGRFEQATREAPPGTPVIRLTGDNPFLDTRLMGALLAAHRRHRADCSAPRGAPVGTGCEVIQVEALRQAARAARTRPEREHVTLHCYRHPDRFRIHHLTVRPDRSHLRLTLDTPEDLELARALAARFGARLAVLDMAELAGFLARRPDLVALNHAIRQREA